MSKSEKSFKSLRRALSRAAAQSSYIAVWSCRSYTRSALTPQSLPALTALVCQHRASLHRCHTPRYNTLLFFRVMHTRLYRPFSPLYTVALYAKRLQPDALVSHAVLELTNLKRDTNDDHCCRSERGDEPSTNAGLSALAPVRTFVQELLASRFNRGNNIAEGAVTVFRRWRSRVDC